MGRKKEHAIKRMEDSPLKELNEMEVTKLSDIVLKIMVIKCSRNSQTTIRN